MGYVRSEKVYKEKKGNECLRGNLYENIRRVSCFSGLIILRICLIPSDSDCTGGSICDGTWLVYSELPGVMTWTAKIISGLWGKRECQLWHEISTWLNLGLL